MDTEKLGRSRIMNLLAKPGGMAMESSLRRRLQNPKKILQGAGLKAGQTVLEVGSGTGFFSLDAAGMITDKGHLIAMDPLADFVVRLKNKPKLSGGEYSMNRQAMTGMGTANINGWRRPSFDRQRSDNEPTSGSVIASANNPMVTASPASVPDSPIILV